MAWRKYSSINGMPGIAMLSFSGGEIIANLLFGSVGFVAFVYGKRMHIWKPMLIGLALMVYTYFVEGPILLYGIGTVLIAGLFAFRD